MFYRRSEKNRGEIERFQDDVVPAKKIPFFFSRNVLRNTKSTDQLTMKKIQFLQNSTKESDVTNI